MKKVATCAYSTGARGSIYVALASSLWLAGCSALPPKAVVDFAEVKPELAAATNAAPARQTSGSLFHLATYRPAFEDSRARALGDIVTIQIVESLSASQVSKSTVNRNTSASNAITPPLPGMIGVDMKNLEMSVKTDNDFSGKGGTEAANTFSGSISTTVVEVLPNGNLVVAGEKQIGVNHNVDVLRFSGQIDPRAIQPGNLVASAQIANVRVEQRGRGQVGDAQQIGWLSRFFLSLSPI